MFQNSADVPLAKTVQLPRRFVVRLHSGLNLVFLVVDEREVIR
jgi:hypothetical protein